MRITINIFHFFTLSKDPVCQLCSTWRWQMSRLSCKNRQIC